MKMKAITILMVLALGAGYTAQAELLDQLRNRTGGVFGGGGTGGSGGGTGGGGGEGGTASEGLFELEPNDTPQTATAISPGQPQSGAFQTAADQDWYRFRVTQAGATATIELPAQTGRFRLSLQNSAGQVLARLENDPAQDRRFSVVLPQTGDFFLVAETLGAVDYSFTVSGTGIALPGAPGAGEVPEGALLELEPNDTPQAATALKPDTFHSGRFQTPTDQDWFRFQATAAGAVEVFIPSSSENWSLSLLDAAGNVLVTQQSAAFDQTFLIVVSTPGDFFVRLTPAGENQGPYLFKLSGDNIQLPLARRNEFLRQAQREAEPNNHIAAANPIEPGRPVSGQLFALEDEDWFSVEATQDRSVVNVEMPAGPARWRISILDAAGNLFEARESSTESDLLFSTLIEKPGKFYLVVSGLDDSRADYTFNVTGEGLKNPGDRNPRANFHNVEIEPNDTLAAANPLTSAVRLVGQLHTSSDIDLFRLESEGDESLSIELCPGNAACAGQISGNSGPWVVYVFDGSRVTQEMLDAKVPLLSCVNDQLATIPTRHLYLSLNEGRLDAALLGVIDPAFGNSRRVEIGLKHPGTFFVAVSSPLKRDEDGSVVLKKEVTCGKDVKIEKRIVIFPFSDDQYELQVVQTRLTPSIPQTSASSSAELGFAGDVLHVPVAEVNGVEYSADLLKFDRDGKVMFELLDVEQIGTAVAATDADALKREAMRATISGDLVHIPLAVYDGHYYAGDLRMFEEDGRTLFEVISAKRLD